MANKCQATTAGRRSQPHLSVVMQSGERGEGPHCGKFLCTSLLQLSVPTISKHAIALGTRSGALGAAKTASICSRVISGQQMGADERGNRMVPWRSRQTKAVSLRARGWKLFTCPGIFPLMMLPSLYLPETNLFAKAIDAFVAPQHLLVCHDRGASPTDAADSLSLSDFFICDSLTCDCSFFRRSLTVFWEVLGTEGCGRRRGYSGCLFWTLVGLEGGWRRNFKKMTFTNLSRLLLERGC